MKTKPTVLIAGAAIAMVVSASLLRAQAQQLTFTDLGGTVRIHVDTVCGAPLDASTAIAAGRAQVALIRYTLNSDVLLDLTRLEIFLTPFSVRRECRGVNATAEFTETGIRLAAPVRVMAGLESR